MMLRWTRRAEHDLLAIGRHIALDNPEAARAWVERLRRRGLDAAENPYIGRVVPELGQSHVRELLSGSYRIVYRVDSEAVVILTVFEGHRRFPG